MKYELVNSTKQVDLGSLDWGKAVTSNIPHFYATISDLFQTGSYGQTTYGYLEGYARDTDLGIPSNKRYNFIAVHNYKQILIRDDTYSTAAEFKAAMSGKILTYVSTDTSRKFDLASTRNIPFIAANVNNFAFASGNIGISPTYRGYTFEVSPGETITVARPTLTFPNRFVLGFTIAYPTTGATVYSMTPANYTEQRLSVTVICPSNCHYCTVYLSNQNQTITDDVGITIQSSKAKPFVLVNDTAQVDLGSLTWYKSGYDQHGFYVQDVPYVQRQDSWMSISGMTYNGTVNAQQYRYTTDEQHFQALYDTSAQYARYRQIYFYDADNITAEQKKAKMSGVILTYQSA